MEEDIGPTLVALRAEIRKTIHLSFEDPSFRHTMLRALDRQGFALHAQSTCRAGVLTLEVCRVISGPPTAAAVQAAVAVELHMQAAYMFDNVADRDKGPSDDISPAEELALAIGLLSCGQATVCEAAFAAGQNGSGLRSMMRLVADCASKCCTGQFLDAHLEKQSLSTADEALTMTSLKAGSLGRFATGLGASIATEDPEIVNLCGEFGFNLFTYLQLVDDLRDAFKVQDSQGDLMQHKKTLPVVFFNNSLTERIPEAVCSIIPPVAFERVKADARQDLESSRARVFGAIVAEAFLNRAKSNLADIKNRLGTVGNLERFVSSFEISPQEVAASL